MSFEDKFDKLVRDKMGEADFPFEEGNWEKASRMIDAERAAAGGAKSSKYFLLFGSLFLVIAGITMFSISILNSSDNGKAVAENAAAVSNTFNSSDNSVEQGSAVNNNNAVSANPSVAENNSSSENNSINNSSDNKSSQNNPLNAVNNYNSNNNNASNNSGNNAESDKNASDMNASSVNAGISAEKMNVGNSGRKNSSAKSSGKEKGAIVTGGGIHDKAGGGKAVAKKNRVKNKSEEELNAAKNNEEILNAQKSPEAESAPDFLEMRKSVLQIWNKEAKLQSSGLSFIRYDEDYFVYKRPFKYFLNLEMGASYLMGWQTSQGRDGAGMNYFAGANFGTYLGRKVIVSGGVQFYNVSHINQPFYSRAAYEYDFGYNGKHTEITTNSIYYAAVPVRITYPVCKTGRIGLGVNTGYLVGGNNTVKTYDESDLVKTNFSETKVKGAYEGVNKMNVMVGLSYSQRFYRRFCVNAEVLYGLNDVYKNNITNNKAFERNIGGRISLTYDIIHH